MPEDSLSDSMVLESKKERVRTIEKPHFHPYVLEEISISCHKLYFAISELDFLVIRAIY
jgi:hypothetical protein